MNVVSIMAHQDDEMRCLGTMLKCQARGDTLAFITVTDGSLGFVNRPEIARAEAAAIRHAEMTALAGAVGAQYVNLREQDEFLYDTPEVRVKLIEAIRRVRPELIFTHCGEDYNLDHTTVHALARQCAMHSCLPVIRTESAPLAASPAIFLVEPHGPFAFPATHYVDISRLLREEGGVAGLPPLAGRGLPEGVPHGVAGSVGQAGRLPRRPGRLPLCRVLRAHAGPRGGQGVFRAPLGAAWSRRGGSRSTPATSPCPSAASAPAP